MIADLWLCLGGKSLEKDKEDMTVPFDEGSQVMHVVSRHAAFAYAGTLLRGVPGDRAIEGTINDAWNTVMRAVDVGVVVLEVVQAN
jgi:hypothetical protein